jgi:hypothetical protein
MQKPLRAVVLIARSMVLAFAVSRSNTVADTDWSTSKGRVVATAAERLAMTQNGFLGTQTNRHQFWRFVPLPILLF